MKDTQLRGLVLQRYYETRRGMMFLPKPEEFTIPITKEEILAISDQLAQHDLIKWDRHNPPTMSRVAGRRKSLPLELM